MKRRFFTFLMAFLATLSGAVWAQRAQTLTDGTHQLSSMSGEYTINGGTHTLTGTANADVWFTITADATITLENANFGCSRTQGMLDQNVSPFHLNNGVSVEMTLVGENIIESKEYTTNVLVASFTARAAGIYVPGDATLTFTENSTGSLTVTGRVGIGTNFSPGLSEWLGEDGSCGNIVVEGGTVHAIGEAGSSRGLFGGLVNLEAIGVGGSSSSSWESDERTGSLTVSDNGVLITEQKIDIPETDRHIDGGILFDASNNGTVIGNHVTLQSPLDLEEHYTLTVSNGKTLELGNGIMIERIGNEGLNIESGGKVIGYMFEYKSGTEGSSYDDSFSTALPTIFCCGPNTKYDVRNWEPNDIEVSEKGTYQHVDGWWLDKENKWVQVKNEYNTGSATISDLQTQTFTAAWVITDRDLYYEATSGLTETVNLWWPTDASFTATETSSGQLDAAGLEISSHELESKTGTIPSEADYNITLSITPSGVSGASALTANIHAHVNQDPIDLNNNRVTIEVVENTVYDGSEIPDGEVLRIYIDKDQHPDATPITGNQYQIKYQKEGESASDWGAHPTDAGTYTIWVKGQGDDASGAFTNTEVEVSTKFVVSKAQLTVSAQDNQSTINWNILDEAKKPTLTDNVKVSGVISGDNVTVTATNPTITAQEGTTGTNWETTPGAYTVSLSNFSLSGEDAGNYEVSGTVTFTLNVYKYYSENSGETPKSPDDLKPGGEDDDTWTWNNNAFERVYDGTAKEIATLTMDGTTISKVDGELSAENQGFTVTYKKKDSEEAASTDAPMNAGDYVAILNIFYNNVGGKDIEMPLRITQKPLTATASEVEWTIGETGPDFSKALTLNEDEICSQGEEKDEVTVTGTNPTGEWKVAGTYTVTYTGLNLTGTDAANYKLSETSVEGTLIVSKSGSLTPGEGDDGEIKIEDEDGNKDGWTLDADGNGYTRVYDGQSHNLSADIIKVKQHKDGEGEEYEWVTIPADNLEITYEYKLTEQGTAASETNVKNAGIYTATIKITGTPENIHYAENTTATITLTITPKEVDVPIKDFTAADVVNEELTLTADNINWEGVLVAGESLDASGKVTFVEKADAETTTYTATFSDLKLEDKEVDGTTYLASNYNATFKYNNTEITSENSTVDVPVDEIEGEISLPSGEWTKEDDGTYSRVYDGKTHNITSIAIGEENAEVTSAKYMYTAPESSEPATEVKDVKDAGTYVATITTSQGTAELTLKIEPKELTITINNQTIEADGTGFDNSDFTVKTGIEDETVTITGTLKYTPATLEAGTVYAGAITVDGTLSMNPDNKNYTIPTTIEGGDLTVKAENPSSSEEDPIVDPDDPKLEGIELVGWENLSHVYDGEIHGLTNMTVTLTNGEETTIGVSTTFTPSEVKNVGTYTAAITVNENNVMEAGTFYVQLAITKRPMQITFKLPATIENTDPIAITTDHLNPETESTGRGLLQKEAPLAVESGQFIFGKPNAQGECTVSIRNFKLDDTDKFLANNYQVQIWNPETGEWEDYDPNSGEDVTIIDPEYPEGNPNNPGGGDSGVVVDPDGSGDDDDDNDHGHGGSDINRPAKYYNMYVDSAATCDGVELWFNKNVVREGNQASVYVKIEEGYDAEHMKLWFKRSLYGYWEELEEGVQPGEYIIYNVYTDIYVKATDVEKDPTGIEEIEGVKVYAQNGSIYVYTPNRLPVWIVSMTGAVVRNEEQVGLQQYDRLNQGIYIVRVGEQVFKIRL